MTTGTIEEIYKLNQESKQQQSYKRCEAIEIGGFVVMLAGAGVAFLGQQKKERAKKRLRQNNSHTGIRPGSKRSSFGTEILSVQQSLSNSTIIEGLRRYLALNSLSSSFTAACPSSHESRKACILLTI